MADCPGILHLAEMADGGLARLRTPGGGLTAAQARAVGAVAARLGSGVVDLTNRANLQIRGLALDGGPALAAVLDVAGFRFEGEADRRRNILLDPFSGLDPHERLDMRPVAAALDKALRAAVWIAALSPKFSFVLDGGGRTGIAATPSDVAVCAKVDGFAVRIGTRRLSARRSEVALAKTLLGIAETASCRGPDAHARDVSDATLSGLGFQSEQPDESWPKTVARSFGAAPTRTAGVVAVTLAVPVGRLDRAMLDFLARTAETEGDGTLRLTPWSAVVVPGVRSARADALLRRAEAAGFTPVAVAERLSVVACAGAPSCERAREPAKTLAREVLALAAREPDLLPKTPRSLHLSACPKGCAGSAPADLLLLGSSDAPGWSLHRDGAPRRPGGASGRLGRPNARDILALLSARR